MQLSTMTNLFYVNTPDGMGYARSVARTADAGFLRQDFCMCPMQRNDSELCLPDWEKRIEHIQRVAEEKGVTFGQSHLPYPTALSRRKGSNDVPGGEANPFFIEMTERAIRISAMLGVEWAIVHPVQQMETYEYGHAADLAYNHEIYDRWVELANSLGVGIAFENLVDVDSTRRFGPVADDLIDLVKSYSGAKVGVCWDFGHGNREFTPAGQVQQLRALAPYLVATHVDDNYGHMKDDVHTAPFIGTVKWEKLMPLLREIGYTGDFNFEIALCRRMPEALKESTVRYLHEIGTYLISLYDKA